VLDAPSTPVEEPEESVAVISDDVWPEVVSADSELPVVVVSAPPRPLLDSPLD